MAGLFLYIFIIIIIIMIARFNYTLKNTKIKYELILEQNHKSKIEQLNKKDEVHSETRMNLYKKIDQQDGLIKQQRKIIEEHEKTMKDMIENLNTAKKLLNEAQNHIRTRGGR